MSEKGKKNKKKTGLGLAIWILTFLIILIIFLVKQEEIKSNFEKSGASALIEKKLGKEKPEQEKTEESDEIVIDLTKNLRKTEPIAPEEKKPEVVPVPTKEVEPQANARPQEDPIEQPSQVQPPKEQQPKPQSQPQQTAEKPKTPPVSEPKSTVQPMPSPTPTVTPTPAPESNMTKAKICFVAIDSDGPVVRKEVSRSVHKDSPMGDALNMLLAGPSASEEKTGCRSLIPSGTRLLSASVKNGVAMLNFSEEFQFNQFGSEGSLAQLMQVVYTATNFSTVKSVQILIEGQKRDYLTEGVWIGSPLSRNSF